MRPKQNDGVNAPKKHMSNHVEQTGQQTNNTQPSDKV